MYSQQSLPKTITNFLNGILSLKNRCNQKIVMFIWIFCLISAEAVSLAAGAPCAGTKGDDCLPDCNTSCLATPCNNTTGECKNNTTEEQVIATDQGEVVPRGLALTCEDGTGECKDNTTEAVVPDTDTEENASPEQTRECDDGLAELGDCENIATDKDIPGEDEEEIPLAAQAAECEKGLYGDNCSLACPANCVGLKCDLVTGDCSSGCIVGYQGSRCADTCTTGFYGLDCKSKCPENCATNECHYENGYCLNGCKEDYWGSDCSLLGEFKDNPEPAQDNFYRHLSAESKSVLLYMLMSKYEETLEKAQMEVRRGIRLRNKLRVIMSG